MHVELVHFTSQASYMMNECASIAIAESLGSIFIYNLLVILHVHTTFLHFTDVLFAQNKATLYLYFQIFNII